MSPRLKSGLIRTLTTGLPILCLFCFGVRARAQCDSTWREFNIRSLSEATESPAISVDLGSNVYLAAIRDGELTVDIMGPGFEVAAPIPSTAEARGAPVAASNSLGATYLAYTQSDGEGERDIFLVNNAGGSFSDPLPVSTGDLDDADPQLALDSDGKPNLVWVELAPGGSRVMYWTSGLVDPIPAFEDGADPAIAVEPNTSHIVFVRGSALYYGPTAGADAFLARPINQATNVTSRSISVVAGDDGTLYVSYVAEGALYLSEKNPGEEEFLLPRQLVAHDVSDPKLSVGFTGEMVLAYVQNGDVYAFVGEDLTDPEQITQTSELESEPEITMDHFGNLHVFFVRASQSSVYSTNACVPEATLSVDPASGPAPLLVQFSDVSSGDVLRREWDFGDGNPSSRENPTHVYEARGVYSVRLTVYGPGGGVSTREMDRLVSVSAPLYTLRIPDQQVQPEQRDVWFPIIATHADPIQGFQIVARHDESFFTFQRTDLSRSAVEFLSPEFYETVVGADGVVTVGCVFDIIPPIEGRALEAGKNHRLTHIVFDVAEQALAGGETRVELLAQDDDERIVTVMTVDGVSKKPVLQSSIVRVRDSESPAAHLFVRGDLDDNGDVNVADAIAILNFLFGGGLRDPECLDTADIQDNGVIDISAPINLLNFLFAGGGAPAVPYPNAGLDPTEDMFGECLVE